MDDALIEEIAEHIYDAWTDDHPNMPPYADASEDIRGGARAAAEGALTGFERAGYKLVRDAGVRSYPAT